MDGGARGGQETDPKTWGVSPQKKNRYISVETTIQLQTIQYTRSSRTFFPAVPPRALDHAGYNHEQARTPRVVGERYPSQ